MARGAADGSWSDAELGAFLMAVAIRGLDLEQTIELTRAMLESGERWRLGESLPILGDKHSTGGVGDKVSLVLAPLLAASGIPVAMLTGRALGHTGGTADKLESIPGLRQELDRASALRTIEASGMALGVATEAIAPADRRLYALRDRTATVASMPLMVASILSKKLATGATAIVFDVKVGDGAFLPSMAQAREMGRLLIDLTRGLDVRSSALLSDMNQPLGEWAGHAAEVREALDCLEGRGPADTVDLTIALATELANLLGVDLAEASLRGRLADGSAREAFARWAVAQGAEASWLDAPELPLAPVERALVAERSGVLQAVATRRLGRLLGEAGAARRVAGGSLDHGIALRSLVRMGDAVESGQELARIHLREDDPDLVGRFADCYAIADVGDAPPLIHDRIG